MTGDAVHLASSERLWPHVAPRRPPADAWIYENTEFIKDAYSDFHWMGEDDVDPDDDDPEPPLNAQQARVDAIGSGTLRDPMIREKCVCPMMHCEYVVSAFVYRVEVVKTPQRTPRPRPAFVS